MKKRIVFIADKFQDELTRGAELSLEALICKCSLPALKVKSNELDLGKLNKKEDFLIFGNFFEVYLNYLRAFSEGWDYAVIESDYKYCEFRSPEKHEIMRGVPCDCKDRCGLRIRDFFMGSKLLCWKSRAQMEFYFELYPELKAHNNFIVSGVFKDEDLNYMLKLRGKYPIKKNHYGLLKSDNWIKGYEDTIQYCRKNGIKASILWNLPYYDFLERLAQLKGFVYMPKGKDTCPRMVTEAKILGCELIINENVQQKHERWFEGNLDDIMTFLRTRAECFWQRVTEVL